MLPKSVHSLCDVKPRGFTLQIRGNRLTLLGSAISYTALERYRLDETLADQSAEQEQKYAGSQGP